MDTSSMVTTETWMVPAYVHLDIIRYHSISFGYDFYEHKLYFVHYLWLVVDERQTAKSIGHWAFTQVYLRVFVCCVKCVYRSTAVSGTWYTTISLLIINYVSNFVRFFTAHIWVAFTISLCYHWSNTFMHKDHTSMDVCMEHYTMHIHDLDQESFKDIRWWLN